MKQFGNLTLGLISLMSGALFAFGFLWIFDIEVSDMEQLRTFPDGWSLRELAFNAFAVMLLVGASRAIYKGLQEYKNPSDDDVPPVGGAF